MSVVHKLETMVAGWLKSVPHLPKGGQKWIATNAWWIVLIGVIASAIGILVTIGGIFTYLAIVGDAASYYGAYYVTSAYSEGWIIGTVVTLLFSVAITIVSALAISPLKAMKKKGWDLLFGSMILRAASVVIGAVLSFSVFGFIFGIIFGAIGIAIGLYFVFEIHSYFGGHAKAAPAKK